MTMDPGLAQRLIDQIAEPYRKLKHNHDDLPAPDIRPLFDIRAYGARTGFGIDNQAAIQAAADAAAAYGFAESCGVLYIPSDGGDDYYRVGAPGLAVSVPILFEGGAVVASIAGTFDLLTWTAQEGHWIRGDGYFSGQSHSGHTLVVSGASEVWIDGPQAWDSFDVDGDAIRLVDCDHVVIGPHTSVQGGDGGIHLVNSHHCILGGVIRQNHHGILYSDGSSHNIVGVAQIHDQTGWGILEEEDSGCDYNICGGVQYDSNTSGNASLVGAHSSCGQAPGSFEEIHLSVWGNDSTVAGNAADVKLPLGSFTDSDVGGLTPSSGVVTIGTNARYEVSFDVKFDPTTDDGYVEAEVRFGAAADAPDTFGGWLIDTERVEGEPATSDFIFLNNSRVFELVAGDRLELYCRVSNSDDGNCSVHGNLTVTWVGPTSRTTSLFA